MSNVYFCSFADARFKPALKRIEQEASSFNLFKEIFIYTENEIDISFKTKYKDKLHSKCRGFGYWIWKPYIILKSLNRISEGDLLVYTDAGTVLNINGKEKLCNYLKTVENSEYGRMCNDGYPLLLEKDWTKGDLFDYFNVRDDSMIYNTVQRGAGVFIIKKNIDNINFVARWLKVFEDNFSLIDDTPSNSPNFDGFKENRHDQSVLSILSKIHGIELIPEKDVSCWDGNWDNLSDSPFLFKRLKQMTFRYRLLNLYKKFCKYLFWKVK